jgi:7-keto-8-aminopelargonate synthetase-like enzyme
VLLILVCICTSIATRHAPLLYRQTHCIGSLREIAREEINKIKDAGTWKSERVITSKQGSLIIVEGHQQLKILNFCSNNYLGLAVSDLQATSCYSKTETYFWGTHDQQHNL